ncbi:MAG: AMP-binding protein, partial [Phycisphaerae bacterium]|nr:AMP-binding protein [Phycisphaerae bacterium]
MLLEPLFAHAADQPDEIAVIDDLGSFSFAQMAAMASGLGSFLARQTDRPHVGLMLPASAGFVGSFYGTLIARKAVVPINFLLGDREIAHVIADSGIDTIVTIPQLAPKLAGRDVKIIDLTRMPPPGDDDEPLPIPSHSPDDLAVLMYTSGTSGLPKGVRLSYENLQSDVNASIEKAALQHGHRFLGVIPLFHAFGMTAMMLAPVQLGTTVVYIARFSPVAAINAFRQHRISIMFGVPSMFAAIAHLKSATADDFKSAYALITGGEPQPAVLRDKFRERFNVELLEGYGLTETSPVVALNTPQNHRAGSVGQPLPCVTVKIIDDDGHALPAGQTGEIWLHGPMIMRGYYNLPAETAAVLTPDRYFKTGDLGHIDEDGYLFITGRKKDMIIVAGEKAFPREIEEILNRHETIADAAVVGKKDPSRGEVVVAFVTAKENQTIQPDTLRDFCRAQGLPQWKIPREITLIDEMPRSPTGKILKR